MLRTACSALCLALVLSAGAVLPAKADRILTGDTTGSYYRDVGPKVKAVLEGKLFRYSLEAGTGTRGNFEAISASPRLVGLGQADAYALLDAASPGIVISIPTLVRECAFALTKNEALVGKSPGEGWGNIQAVGHRLRVALPNPKSGSSLTWQFIQSFNANLNEVGSVVNHDSTAAALDAAAKGEADIAFFVQMPDVRNPIFKKAKTLGLKWIGVGGRDMLLQTVRTQRGKQQVYFVDTVPVEETFWGFGAPKTVTTSCTRVVVMTGDPDRLVRNSPEERQQRELVAAIGSAPEVAFEPDNATYKSTVAQIRTSTEAELKTFLERVDTAAQQTGEAVEQILKSGQGQ